MWPEPRVLASLSLSLLVAASGGDPAVGCVSGGRLPWHSEGTHPAGTVGHREPGGAWVSDLKMGPGPTLPSVCVLCRVIDEEGL